MEKSDYQKESVEQIDELNKKTLGSYIRKASSDLARKTSDADLHNEYMGDVGTSKDRLAQERKKISQRKRGIGQAVSRLTTEAHIGKSGFPTQDERTFADRIKLGAKLDAKGETKGAEKRAYHALDKWAQRKATMKNSVKEETLLEKFKKVSSEIRHLMKDKGYPQKRAVAAALSMKREGKLSEEKTKDTYDPRAAQAIANAYRERKLKNKKKKGNQK
jgi:hypothetical protein